MSKKMSIGLILALLLTLMATAVQAQSGGSIRGNVREDTNGDGKCTDGAAIVGMTIEFKSSHAEMVTVYLQSGDDGSYGLVAAGLGSWEVTAKPNSDYRITSAKTVPVFIDENQSLALGIDFCAQKTSGTTTTGTTVLPQSGGVVPTQSPAQALTLAALLGGMLFVTGAGLEYRRRHNL